MEVEMKTETRNLVVVSDLHVGCQLGLCPSGGLPLDEGGVYSPSKAQRAVWRVWREFWDKWVPMATRGEGFDLVMNGDAIDGSHHGSTHQISHNPADQEAWAFSILEPIVAHPKCNRYYHIRGTEAHVGQSGEAEERLARRLGAIPNEVGQHARYELWKRVGPALVHVMHHIGTTGSQAYESTAVHKELVEAYVEAGRWGDEPPDVLVRAHRHRSFETRIPAKRGAAIATVTPGWQLKTPFVWKIAGARQSQPQFGGLMVRAGDEDPIYVRHFVQRLARGAVEK